MLTALVLTGGIAVIMIAGLSLLLAVVSKENRRLLAEVRLNADALAALRKRLAKLGETSENRHTEKAELDRQLEVIKVQLAAAERLNKSINAVVANVQEERDALQISLNKERGTTGYWKSQCEQARAQLKAGSSPQA